MVTTGIESLNHRVIESLEYSANDPMIQWLNDSIRVLECHLIECLAK